MITRPTFVLLLFFVGFSTMASSQSTDLLLTPTSVSKEVIVNTLEVDFEDISTIRLSNTGNQDLKLRWAKRFESQPGGWQAFVYAKKPGYGPYTASQYAQTNEQPSFTIAAGETLEYYLILRPNDKSGKGRVEITFTAFTQPDVVLGRSVFDFHVLNREQVIRTTTNTAAGRGTTRVYPNPAVDNFFVELPRGVGAGKVEIFNTLGRKLRTFTSPDPEKGYLINDLPEGIYLINVYDDRGEKLKTLRLLHRRFGA